MGGIQFPLLNELARKIWCWCEKRKLWIYASYIKSSKNIKADIESSRLVPDTEYEISNQAFPKIVEKWGRPEMDL